MVLALNSGLANAQTQASCQFNTFNTRLYVDGNYRTLFPLGVNDYNTVVGDRVDDRDFSVRGFTRWSNGSITYYQHNSTDTFFTDRTNDGVTIGMAGDEFALGSMGGTPFTLKGSTFTPLTITVNGKTYDKFTVLGRNRYGTIVGIYPGASHYPHGFKRFSDGHTVAIDFPGAAETCMALPANASWWKNCACIWRGAGSLVWASIRRFRIIPRFRKTGMDGFRNRSCSRNCLSRS
jgi:hypothetical protein